MDIETPRLLLIENYRVVPEHVKWLNDKELMKWSDQQFQEHDWRTQQEFLNKCLVDGNPTVFDIRVKRNGLPDLYSVGTIHLYVDPLHPRGDMGILIGPEHHGKGYALEAWRTVTQYAFVKLGLHKLEGGTCEANVPMVKVFVGAGWHMEGRRENHFLYGEQSHDMVMYGRSA